MKQSALNFNLSAKKTRKREFLEQIDKVVRSAGRTHRALLPRRQEGSPAVLGGNHAAHALPSAVVHPVRPWHPEFDIKLRKLLIHIDRRSNLPLQQSQQGVMCQLLDIQCLQYQGLDVADR